MVLTMLLILFRPLSGAGQVTLLTESFENGGSIPAGWATEVISPNNQVTFTVSSTYPSGYPAVNGSWMTKFNSYDASGGVIRLKRITPVSTINHNSIGIDFAWLESTGYPSSNDKVDVEWSTDGTTWNTAATYIRYNTAPGWKIKNVSLPAGASGQPALYIAFKFTSGYGNNCFLDLAHITGVGPPPPATITVGTGTTPCSYPYTTSYMDARTQLLYTAAELGTAGATVGEIQQVGFNVATAAPTVMNGFTIKMRNTSAATISTWVTDSMAVCYSGSYTVAGTGWQMITLQTPFYYDGRNLVVEICFDNATTGTGSTVYGDTEAGKIYHYFLNDPVGGGCAATGNSPQTIRPNLRIVEQPWTGTLTGTVLNCYNGQPLNGANVWVSGVPPVSTNASGMFTVFNIPCGTHTVTYSMVNFIPKTCIATILHNQTTISPCGCVNPIPGYLAGVITDLATGDPIPGVKVQAGTTYTYSLSDGSYSLAKYPCGTFTVIFSKAGYNPFTQLTTFMCGSTLTQNVQMMPMLAPPATVTAVTDTVIGKTTLTWTEPQTPYEIIYDDGIEDQCFAWMNTGNLCAVKFTPAAYPATVLGGSVFLCPPVPSTPSIVPFQLAVFDDNGPGGEPGSAIDTFDILPMNFGWGNFIFSYPITITSGSFFFVWIQTGGYPNTVGLGLDTTSNSMRSWTKDEYNSGPWVPVQGNFMIRALISGAGGTMPPSMLNYTVSRLIQGQESTPSQWTTLGNVTGGTTTYVDNSWNTLPPGPYRWAVQTYYSTWMPSAAAFSNIQYKDWMSYVTVHAEPCCTDITGPINLKLSSIDTTYYAETDTAGNAFFQDVIYNNYTLTLTKFGCQPYSVTFDINSDTVVQNTIMGSGYPYPPRWLSVDCQTLLATWNMPGESITAFSENWSSGNFTANGWTTSGGANWMISPTAYGNTPPSAIFYWMPQVTNYDQYLTSKVFTGMNAPLTILGYDILLDNYSTTIVNNLAIEFWDGSTWSVLKTYGNNFGTIQWTSEIVVLPVVGTDNFKIRFHAYGADSYGINAWAIDNIRIILSDTLPGIPPDCLLGYGFSINSNLGPFVTDTFYYIPPNQVQYGQTYTASVEGVYGYNAPPNISTPATAQFTSCFLYPPANFASQPLECSAWLTWDKPQQLGGGDPPGLIGYFIYRGYQILDTINAADTLQYYDLGLNPGYYNYIICARYDLSAYGFPGQFGTSQIVNSPGITVTCGDNLPFLENWNSGTFAYSGWSFEPAQGNWDVTSATGNPSPTADFSGFGLKSNGPYDYAMISPPLDASQWTCSNVWLDFDLKLIDQAAGGTEHLTVEVLYDNAWHQVADYVNTGSFGFDTEHILINEVRGQGTKIRFRAHGENTFSILHWYIDNINVYGVCQPPLGLTWSATSEHVDLSWEAPCPEVTGYNIYRTDSSGLDPFYMINTDLVTATAFTDYPPYWTPNAVYRYYVTAVTLEQESTVVLCESGSTDTVLVEFPVTVPGLDPASVEVFPNPAWQMFTVKSSVPLLGIELIDHLGKSVLVKKSGLAKVERIRTSDISDGVYFLKINTSQGMVVRKLIIRK